MITIYHNPRCGKSRDCLAFIQNSNLEYEVIKYLETPFSKDELTKVIGKLKIKPIELVRTKEPIWVEKYKNSALSDAQIIQAMIDHPILIERPIAVRGNKAIIARPLDKIKEIL